MKKILAMFFLTFSAFAFAEYKIISNTEFTKLEGTWIPENIQYGNWIDTGNLYDCDGSWSPTPNSVSYGQSFTQSQTCSQNQERTVTEVQRFTSTNETRDVQKENEQQVISVNRTRTATGTKLTGRCEYKMGDTTSSFDKYIAMRNGYNVVIFKYNDTNRKDGLSRNDSNYLASKPIPTSTSPYIRNNIAYWRGSYRTSKYGYDYYKICRAEL